MTETAAAVPRVRWEVARRAGVTALLAIVYAVIVRVPLPYVHAFAVPSLPGASTPTIGHFGLTPVVSAFLVVELAALAVPGLRLRRHGSAEERAGLARAAWLLAIAFAALQALGLVSYMRQAMGPYGIEVFRGGRLEALVLGITLVAGTALASTLALAISRHGLGNGFAVLLASQTIGWIVRRVVLTFTDPLSRSTPLSLLLTIALVVIVARALRGDRGEEVRVPLPTCGLVPLTMATSAWVLPAAVLPYVLGYQAWRPLQGVLDEYRQPGIFLLSLGLVLLFASLFSATPRVAAAWAAARISDQDPEAVTAACRKAHRASLLLVSAIAAAPLVAGELGIAAPVSVVGLSVLAATAMDVAAEARARARHGALVPAFPFQRVYAVEPALAALARAGIPAVARARYYRTLTQFFDPYAPVEILVPAERARQAAAICSRIARPEAPDASPLPDLEGVFE